MTGERSIFLSDAAATEAFGASLAPLVRPGDAILLHGDLGAGKTGLARGLLRALGLAGEAPSPTFAVVQPYDPPDVRLPVLHVDLYRVEDPAELEELGLAEPHGDALLLVEWPERAGEGMWSHALHLFLEPEAGGRALTWERPPGWEDRWPT